VAENRVKLTDRERFLITGIFKQNSKQQLKLVMSSFIKDKFKQESGGFVL
jgi:hypothetical protein